MIALYTIKGIAQPVILNQNIIDAGAPYEGFIVRFAKGTPERKDKNRAIARFTEIVPKMVSAGELSTVLSAVSLSHKLRLSIGSDVVAPNRKLASREAAAMLRQLAALPGVEYVEPNGISTIALTPNDSQYSQQWQYFDAIGGIRADQAWDLATGAGVSVAVLDTGITAHSDLSANILAGWDFISNAGTANDGDGRDGDASDPGDWHSFACSDGLTANSSWHGTHVSGSIAALTNNASGVAGTAFGAKVLPVRVLGVCGGTLADIADGIVWASGGSVAGVPTLASNAVPRVLNLSLGGAGGCSSTYQYAIDFARSRGVAVVVAAGNASQNVANTQPANCNGVIAVASTGTAGAISTFSNYGSGITISAPGQGILSTWNAGTTVPGAQTYVVLNGTSMAAPHVSGVVALVQSRRLALSLPPMFPEDIKTLLMQTARPLPGICPNGCGAGIVNAVAAVQAAAVAAPRSFTAGSFSLAAGSSLNAVTMALNYQTDGNLVIYTPTGTPIWASNTGGRTCTSSTCLAIFQSDGNLVLYKDGAPYWATNTQLPGGRIIFSSVEPYVAIYGSDSTIRYSSSPLVGVLGGTFVLQSATSLAFAGGRLTFQTDGDLVIYDAAGNFLWNTNTGGLSCSQGSCIAAFQGDGNLVLYQNGYPYFATNTVGSRFMFIQASQPYVQIFDNSNQVVWPTYQ